MVALGQPLDLTLFEVFSNLNDTVILRSHTLGLGWWLDGTKAELFSNPNHPTLVLSLLSHSGTCRRRVPRRAQGCTTGWTGCPTSSPSAKRSRDVPSNCCPSVLFLFHPYFSSGEGGCFSFPLPLPPAVASSPCVSWIGLGPHRPTAPVGTEPHFLSTTNEWGMGA